MAEELSQALVLPKVAQSMDYETGHMITDAEWPDGSHIAYYLTGDEGFELVIDEISSRTDFGLQLDYALNAARELNCKVALLDTIKCFIRVDRVLMSLESITNLCREKGGEVIAITKVLFSYPFTPPEKTS